MKLKAWLYYTIVISAILFAGQAQAETATCSVKTITVLGDSLAAGYGLPPGKGFPEQLGAALKTKGYKLEIQNAGVSGDTTSGGLARLNWSIGDGVDLVIVELGANDALRGIPLDVTRANLEEIISQLKSRGIAVLLAGMLAPPNMGEAYGSEFRSIYAELADRYQVAFYPFFLDGVAADPALNLDDGIHPNEKGIDVIVSRILPTVEASLNNVCEN